MGTGYPRLGIITSGKIILFILCMTLLHESSFYRLSWFFNFCSISCFVCPSIYQQRTVLITASQGSILWKLVLLSLDLILKVYFCSCVHVCTCMYICAVCMYRRWWSQKRVLPLWSLSYRQSWASWCGCWEVDLGSLEEQRVVFTTEQSLQPLVCFWERISFNPGQLGTSCVAEGDLERTPDPPYTWDYGYLQLHTAENIFF